MGQRRESEGEGDGGEGEAVSAPPAAHLLDLGLDELAAGDDLLPILPLLRLLRVLEPSNAPQPEISESQVVLRLRKLDGAKRARRLCRKNRRSPSQDIESPWIRRTLDGAVWRAGLNRAAD